MPTRSSARRAASRCVYHPLPLSPREQSLRERGSHRQASPPARMLLSTRSQRRLTVPVSGAQVGPLPLSLSLCQPPAPIRSPWQVVGHLNMGLATLELVPSSDPAGLPSANGDPVDRVRPVGRWHVHHGG